MQTVAEFRVGAHWIHSLTAAYDNIGRFRRQRLVLHNTALRLPYYDLLHILLKVSFPKNVLHSITFVVPISRALTSKLRR